MPPGSEKLDLKLETFCIGAKCAQGEFPCVLRNSPLVNALETLAVSLEVLFSVHFGGVCGHERPLGLTNSGLLIHSVEGTFKKSFRIVSKEDCAIDFPGSDVTRPEGCAALMKRMLADLVFELIDVAKATILEKNYNMLIRLSKSTEAAAARAAQSTDKPAKGVPPPE